MVDSGGEGRPKPAGVPRGLVLASFLSSFDRFAVTPMLVAISVGLGVPLGSAVLVASGYFLSYGCAQPVWGMLSDRYGRVKLMRVTLAAAAVCGVLSALAPSLPLLVALRVLTGAFFGAVIPTSMTYLGDTVPMAIRQHVLSDLQLSVALGTSFATVIAGGLAVLVSWRLVFALPALMAATLAVTLRTVPEPTTGTAPGHPLRQLATVLRTRWAWLLYSLALVEGAVLLGCFTFLAPALEHRGYSASVAGLVIALYGVGTMGFSRILKRLSTPTWQLMIYGGGFMCLGFLSASVSQSPVGIGCAAILLGAGWSFLHSSLQTWATAVVPRARGTSVALFAASLFIGSAIGSLLAAPLAERFAYPELFGIAAAVTVVLTAVGASTRRRYRPPPG
ncbi:MFS transporter [Pseudonocardia spinosispora]|uniref:MFS transporter n=1 Tax=Pseudonocardia spinosispora TaxID=103441 RepID=UPI0003F8D2A0|nr:MFS transporter [Pseudonocardia spinosispora]